MDRRISPLCLPVPVVECNTSDEEHASLLIPRVNTPVPSRNSNYVSHNKDKSQLFKGNELVMEKIMENWACFGIHLNRT